ncbi:ClpX, ATPase regulatory subunit [Sistotremastrum niveocremeum HHB9708]|uniref:ClpX, ATPase regulatory subunit n=1 Tax=Sistotremastrum niveocremeum HHB9708 TaxID=1314777 RepID=A0A164ZIH1_9AGAM|nr:ClpX, ATPase regulatory subunit [Sistotremastrum niveocremeum HHB9708]
MFRHSRRHGIVQFIRTIRTQPRYDYVPRQEVESTFQRPIVLATPRQLVQYLDEFIVGQPIAKKILSVAIYNHYNRVRANITSLQEEPPPAWNVINSQPAASGSRSPVTPANLYPHPYRVPFASPFNPLSNTRYTPLFEKSNVLMIGPTGSGKTLLVRTLAKVLDVPFSVSDATAFTQVSSDVGEDVEMCIQRLLQSSNWDAQRASMGIVYIDEVDKLSRRGSGSGSSEGSRDVGGEGVQQALLRMMEGGVVTVQTKAAPPSSSDASQGSPERSRRPGFSAGRKCAKQDTYQVDTSNVLFICSGAFVGLEDVIRRRVARGSIGFTANLAGSKLADDRSLPFFNRNGAKKPELLDLVRPEDLVKYGFIPEFVSRLPTLATLSPLTTSDLYRILTEVRGSLMSQYVALFGYSGVEIRFTTAAVREVCKSAAERGGGARGLRGIMEKILLEPMYEVPGSGIRHVLINQAVAQGRTPALYWSRGDGAAFWAAWAEEESKLEKDHDSL